MFYSWLKRQWKAASYKYTKDTIEGYIEVTNKYSINGDLLKLLSCSKKDLDNLKYNEDKILIDYRAKMISNNWNSITIKIKLLGLKRMDSEELNNWRVDKVSDEYEKFWTILKSKEKEIIEYAKKSKIFTNSGNSKIIFE
jgi:hypothetical protein